MLIVIITATYKWLVFCLGLSRRKHELSFGGTFMRFKLLLLSTFIAAGCNSDAKKIAPKSNGGSSNATPPGGVVPSTGPIDNPSSNHQIPDVLSENWTNQVSTINQQITEINARKIASEANLAAATENLNSLGNVTSDQDKEVRELLRTVVVKYHCELKNLKIENHENDLRKAEIEAWLRGDLPSLSIIQNQILELTTSKITCDKLHTFMASERSYIIDTSFIYTGTIEALNAKKVIIDQRIKELAEDLSFGNATVITGEIEAIKNNINSLSSVGDLAALLTQLKTLRDSGVVSGSDLNALKSLISSLEGSSSPPTLVQANIANLKKLQAQKEAQLAKVRGSSEAMNIINSSLNAEKELTTLMIDMYQIIFKLAPPA